MEEISSKLDIEKIRSRETSMPYPHLFIEELSSCCAVVIQALDEGNVPLIATYKGTTKIVKKISNSVYNIDKLLRVTTLRCFDSKDSSIQISSVLDYMEVVNRWI